MATNRQILDLRRLVTERFTASTKARPDQIVTGLLSLDHATSGGLHKGEITEFISPHHSAGSASLIHAFLHLAKRERFFLALVDGFDSFDPQTAEADTLQHLLWVRCDHVAKAVKAADFLLRDGNFPLLILDLVVNSPAQLRSIPATSWYRLQRLVEAASTAFVVMSRYNLVASARTKIVLDQPWTLAHLKREQTIPKLRVRRSAIELKASA